MKNKDIPAIEITGLQKGVTECQLEDVCYDFVEKLLPVIRSDLTPYGRVDGKLVHDQAIIYLRNFLYTLIDYLFKTQAKSKDICFRFLFHDKEYYTLSYDVDRGLLLWYTYKDEDLGHYECLYESHPKVLFEVFLKLQDMVSNGLFDDILQQYDW